MPFWPTLAKQSSINRLSIFPTLFHLGTFLFSHGLTSSGLLFRMTTSLQLSSLKSYKYFARSFYFKIPIILHIKIILLCIYYSMPRVPTLTSPSSREHAQYKGEYFVIRYSQYKFYFL